VGPALLIFYPLLAPAWRVLVVLCPLKKHRLSEAMLIRPADCGKYRRSGDLRHLGDAALMPAAFKFGREKSLQAIRRHFRAQCPGAEDEDIRIIVLP